MKLHTYSVVCSLQGFGERTDITSRKNRVGGIQILGNGYHTVLRFFVTNALPGEESWKKGG
jgi:hypothetical protein